jgi:hypothetical protein
VWPIPGGVARGHRHGEVVQSCVFCWSAGHRQSKEACWGLVLVEEIQDRVAYVPVAFPLRTADARADAQECK